LTQEILDLKDIVTAYLKDWKEDRPKEILVHHTGVSKLIYTKLWEKELEQIQEATKQGKETPSITLVLV
jgi:hypothetical protein